MRHKVFVSYHHANDQADMERFEHRFSTVHDICHCGWVEDGDIDPRIRTDEIRRRIRDEHLFDSSVTVVLVGTHTWQRKHVDWEIDASLSDTRNSPRSGLLGLLLASYQKAHLHTLKVGSNGDVIGYDAHTIPPRLHDNVANGYAALHLWSDLPALTQERIHAAYLRKNRLPPNNGRDRFADNRTGDRWSP